MSPLQAFEIFFIVAQVVRNSVEASYALAKKVEDVEYKSIVGFCGVIIALWFLTALLERNNIHPISHG
jgi:hypothetical protein